MKGWVPSGSPRTASSAYRIAFAVFLEIRVVRLGQYDETRLGAMDPGVVEPSALSVRGGSGGRTGSANRGGERLLGFRRVTNLVVLLRVRLLPDELEGRDREVWDSGC